MNVILEWLKSLSGGEITGLASLIALICGFILKKTGVLKVIRDWFAKINDMLEVVGKNLGVTITTKANSIPMFGLFWEYLIEPILACVLELIPNALFKFFSGLTTGLREDNKEIKSLK
jgi:hypothetical protein